MNYGTVSCSAGTIAFASVDGSFNEANVVADVGGVIEFKGKTAAHQFQVTAELTQFN